MKRSLLFCLVTALVVVLSAGLACAQTFSRIIVDVPSGWSASESESGATVTLQSNSDSTAQIVITVGKKGTSTLQDVANYFYQQLGGTNLEQGNGGYYVFNYTSSGEISYRVYVDDENTDPRINTGDYCITGISLTSNSEEVFQAVLDSITFRVWSESSGESPSTGTGTTKTFTDMRLSVPSGWTASESDSGVVTIINTSNTADMIFLQLSTLGTSTLQNVANNYYSELGGTGGINQGGSGYYYFNGTDSSGTSLFHKLDDHYTDSKVPEGYYWWSCFSSEDAVDVFFEDIYDTLTFSTGSGGTSGGGTSGGSSDGSSGGCSAGTGALSLLVLALAFIPRKHS